VAETTDTKSINKVQSGIAGFKGFLGEVKVEMQKCNWPTLSDLKEQTTVVIVSVLLLTVVIWLSDTILSIVSKVVFNH